MCGGSKLTGCVPQLFRLISRYGLSYFTFLPLPKQLGVSFQRLYKRKVAQTPHAKPQDLLQAADLYGLTQRSFQQEVQARAPLLSSPAARPCSTTRSS